MFDSDFFGDFKEFIFERTAAAYRRDMSDPATAQEWIQAHQGQTEALYTLARHICHGEDRIYDLENDTVITVEDLAEEMRAASSGLAMAFAESSYRQGFLDALELVRAGGATRGNIALSS
jgi:hypothetical protein